MKIKSILADSKPSISFEVFPPKTDAAFESVASAIMEIAAMKPSFISVTYGAGGGTSRYTMEIARSIQQKYGVPTLAHLTCVSSDRATVRQRIADLQEHGIENIMALRGDLTPEMDLKDSASWDYAHAIDLIREVKGTKAGFCIGGACYPEVHPESVNQEEDIRHIREKVDAGVEFLTTQMFFDNNLLYNFLYKLREAGVTVPVVPGIMPITNAKQVERSIKLSGCYVPQRFKSLVDKFGENPAAMKQAGIIYACDQIIDLFANGISHVHVYTMNNPQVAAKILENLSGII